MYLKDMPTEWGHHLLALNLRFPVYEVITMTALGFCLQALFWGWFDEGKWKQGGIVSCKEPGLSSDNTGRINIWARILE